MLREKIKRLICTVLTATILTVAIPVIDIGNNTYAEEFTNETYQLYQTIRGKLKC